MSSIVDARGLSCPQPVLMTMKEIQKVRQGEIIVLVDTDTARENVTRAAVSKGWTLKGVEPDGAGCRVVLTRE
ncbi:MAG: sulfurtransferase TusA family protein [Acidobacteriota bacterium]|jgi:TusA-related sulfurtransferase|nr:sulfurtransferase TusA family protein [Acidobacteriota bacterium]NLT34224.1 preprotein translocase subunit TatB [Acidobacteriota bacterium]